MEREFTPERYEAMAREVRHIAQHMTHPVNIAVLLKQAQELEARAAEMRRAVGVRQNKALV